MQKEKKSHRLGANWAGPSKMNGIVLTKSRLQVEEKVIQVDIKQGPIQISTIENYKQLEILGPCVQGQGGREW